MMPMLYRIWCKARRPYLTEWELGTQGHWDAAVRGNSALRSALIGTLFDEIGYYRKENSVTILWDMEKFYDNINIITLIDLASELLYPTRLLALGLAMHMAPKGNEDRSYLLHSRPAIWQCPIKRAIAVDIRTGWPS